ncbi:LysM peptidoglycan-binding domain-containing protein [Polyangium sp. 15x6]|uniref:LysM peptidoglycan-binding domain-containing protein n=1 Tax=Polyangium sp. 15x6 TaxID=3042687 RepID=UPI00249A9A6B|nr:LysM peptidoglycan-binding domain-containing protein [Polyangium sp. 15x6]MDI3287576.1 Clp protease N-terminal domain-containing protein [Polyangium sp. 15x6]
MIVVDIKRLIRKLSRACVTALEGAVLRTVNAKNPEVTPVHMLLALLDDATCDVSIVVEQQGIDRAALRHALLAAEAALPGGHTGRPIFSPVLIELLQDAWTFGSIRHEYTTVRSGMLLALIRRMPTRYDLAAIDRHVRPGADAAPDSTALPRICATSGEAQEAARPRAPQSNLPGPREEVLYRVRAGDTLLGVAREFALDVEQVAEENRLHIHDELLPGTLLRLRVLPDVIEQNDAAARRLH